MTGPMILTLTTFLPLAGAMLIMALRVVGGANMASGASKGISLLTSLLTLGASLVALSQFDQVYQRPGVQLEQQA